MTSPAEWDVERNHRDGAAAAVATALQDFFTTLDHAVGECVSRQPGVVAFSGGADSTALLAALARRRRGGPPLVAAHLDHAADPGSADRARLAADTARRLGVPFVTRRLAPGELAADASGAGGWEAAARRARYRFLAAVATAHGAAWVATAHHRDDQAETVLLRLVAGSGLGGLAAIQPWRPLPAAAKQGVLLVRPLLGLPRATLAAAVETAAVEPGLQVAIDPTNRDTDHARNRVRHHLLPALSQAAAAAGEEAPAPRLARLAAAARGARRTLDRRLAELLEAVPLDGDEEADAAIVAGLAVERRRLTALPAALLPHALAHLHRRAGAPYPAGRRSRRELARQIGAGDDVGCDCGAGWRWEGRGDRLLLLRRRGASPLARFSYILEVPGEVEIAELSLVLRLHPAPPAAWMYHGAADRAGLALPLTAGDRVTVRNRRPGDRLHPLGAAGTRRLKELLIDRRVPRQRRDLLPLLCLGEQIAWVPGVTVAEAYRLPAPTTTGATVWVAELEAAKATSR